jgi:polyribonucleotide nucleotidyltransferase
MEFTVKTEIGDKTLSISSGKIAKQASGAVTVQYGETIVLVSVVSPHKAKEGLDFLPLTVEYQEKIYAAGRIPGNYFRREIGRPSEKEILTCRLIDRPIRPLFPKGYRSELQIIATVLSTDQENDPDVLAMIGASAALEISDIPFDGPIAAVRVARTNGEFITNPTKEECENSDINIVIAGSKTGIIMVEGGGDVVSETDMIDAIFFGHEAIKPLIEIQIKLKDIVGVEKREFNPPVTDQELSNIIETEASNGIKEALSIHDKIQRSKALKSVKNDLREKLKEEYSDRKGEIGEIFDSLLKSISRSMILDDGRRIGDRKFDEVRSITCEAGILPRPHGSALFTRGETQVLGVLTLGSGQDEQRVETLSGEEFRPFMLHYNFPPFSVGEARRMGGPSRRDIGHGALATRAIEKILPSKEDFDYTIRLVSEVFESNGSSSMGTVCSGVLALMDGGVPIKAPVSGIAMGLVQDGDKTIILSDILGDEDHFGDMDFKVAGSKDGITALQMDIKIKELSKDVMERALNQARDGRLHILDKMVETLDKSRDEISPYAPKVMTLNIKPDKIREIIGPGGKVIRAIQAETNTRVEVNDEGLVKISAVSQSDGEAALERIKEIVLDPEVGAIYEGKVVKITDFGAFVQILPGTDGLCHISQLSNTHVKKVTDVVTEGQTLKVEVLEVTRDGKIRLSHKSVMDK